MISSFRSNNKYDLSIFALCVIISKKQQSNGISFPLKTWKSFIRLTSIITVTLWNISSVVTFHNNFSFLYQPNSLNTEELQDIWNQTEGLNGSIYVEGDCRQPQLLGEPLRSSVKVCVKTHLEKHGHSPGSVWIS